LLGDRRDAEPCVRRDLLCFRPHDHLVTRIQIHHAAPMIAAHITAAIASPTRHPAAGPIGASYSSGSTGSNVGGGITAGRIRPPASATPPPPFPSRTGRPRPRRVRCPASRPTPAT